MIPFAFMLIAVVFVVFNFFAFDVIVESIHRYGPTTRKLLIVCIVPPFALLFSVGALLWLLVMEVSRVPGRSLRKYRKSTSKLFDK